MFWVFQLIGSFFRLPSLLSTRRVQGNLCFFLAKVVTILGKGIFHLDLDRRYLPIHEMPHIFLLLYPLPVFRRIILHLWQGILNIIIAARIHKEAIIDFCIAVNPWPFSVHVWGQQSPIWIQEEPHMSGTCELAMLVEASRLKGTHLHSANIEAFGPTVRHTVNHISPLTKATIPWEKNRNLGLLCTTATPGTSCFLFKHSSKDALFEGGKLLQDIIDRKVKPINLEFPNERRKIFVTIHCPKVKVELSTAKGVFPLIG